MELKNNDKVNQNFSNVFYIMNQYWVDNQDPRTKHLPLVDHTPLPIILIMLTYYLMVTKFIPNFMKNRDPYKLRLPMLLYNIFMVVSNAYFFYEALIRFDYGRVLLNFEYPTDKTSTPTIRHDISLGKSLVFITSKN
jgi:hypothetical protein